MIGGHLITITSPEEQGFAASLAFTWSASLVRDCWLGGFQDRAAPDYTEPAGGWRWVTGEAWGFTSWRPDGQPTNVTGLNDYIAATTVPSDGLGWVDSQSNHRPGNCSPFVEWSADCNNDGIVDYGQIRSGELDDANTNNIPDCCEQGPSCNCPADVDGSGAVNGVDLAAILNVWGTSGGKYPTADINGDGTVNATDLAAVLNAWGPCS
ncbi:MAG: dockerin type I domain-containing protein, partial [Phycisphaerales bacterium]